MKLLLLLFVVGVSCKPDRWSLEPVMPTMLNLRDYRNRVDVLILMTLPLNFKPDAAGSTFGFTQTMWETPEHHWHRDDSPFLVLSSQDPWPFGVCGSGEDADILSTRQVEGDATSPFRNDLVITQCGSRATGKVKTQHVAIKTSADAMGAPDVIYPISLDCYFTFSGYTLTDLNDAVTVCNSIHVTGAARLCPSGP